ncbi:MAG: glycoside hydrolase family 43 protein [Polaribacter sp.]|uniref:glycoside hydrolase family 43 protein n=1 Tax=Polaribacter sp. TaxID=1920175 RepID=UPI003BAF5659
MYKYILLLIFSLLFYNCSTTKPYTKFKTAEKWLDNNKVHINAHGGGFLIYNKTYYWYGEHKISGEKGNKAMVGVRIYSSKDLYNWKNEGVALQMIKNTSSKLQIGSIVERPKVIYNKKTNKFVMWFHHELKDQAYKAALTGVAVSDNITGPFEYINSFRIHANQLPINLLQKDFDSILPINENQKLTKQIRIEQAKLGQLFKRDFENGQMSRDMTLFVDDDETAYHITASEENQTLLISKLTDDYLSLTNDYIRIFPGQRNEAPAIFKRKGKYFMFTSGLTGWNPNPGKLAIADKLMGNWTFLGNPCRGTKEEMATTFWSQSTYVIPVIGKKDAFIFAADRWRPKNPIDGRYVWLPVQFENDIPFLELFPHWDLSIFKN